MIAANKQAALTNYTATLVQRHQTSSHFVTGTSLSVITFANVTDGNQG